MRFARESVPAFKRDSEFLLFFDFPVALTRQGYCEMVLLFVPLFSHLHSIFRIPIDPQRPFSGGRLHC